MNRNLDRRLANLERITQPIRNSMSLREWIAGVEKKGWDSVADVFVRFSNGARLEADGRDNFYERLAELERAGTIDDSTGVEIGIFHIIVSPKYRDDGSVEPRPLDP
jgi:hypothetical protein